MRAGLVPGGLGPAHEFLRCDLRQHQEQDIKGC